MDNDIYWSLIQIKYCLQWTPTPISYVKWVRCMTLGCLKDWFEHGKAWQRQARLVLSDSLPLATRILIWNDGFGFKTILVLHLLRIKLMSWYLCCISKSTMKHHQQQPDPKSDFFLFGYDHWKCIVYWTSFWVCVFMVSVSIFPLTTRRSNIDVQFRKLTN
jgi:hypothetical protein